MGVSRRYAPRNENTRKSVSTILLIVLLFALLSCSSKPSPSTLTMIIESSPANLDPRVGTDAQSERIDMLLFDALLRRDEHYNLKPWLAESWEIPNPLTYIFHLRSGVRFADGRPLTGRDVKWTIDSMTSGKIRTPRAASYSLIDHIDTPDDRTVIIHLKEPYASLLWNLSDGAIGIVPYGSDETFNLHPVGSGPFKLVSLSQDKDIVLARNDEYWNKHARVSRVRLLIVPDTTTRALELRKGSADVAINALTADMVAALQSDPKLAIEISPGSIYQYLAMNLRDPILKDVRVRRALAYAIDRQAIIHYLIRDMARPAASILPPEHWAYDPNVRTYNFDPQHARKLLDEAGYPERNGVRFHLTMKTSTEESTRLLAAVLQHQLADVGIALDIRTFEFATFYADVQKGAFQLYSLTWVGGNEDPDIFEHVFDSASFPPKRANRGYYSNRKVDALIAEGRRTVDQQRRKQIYAQLQEIIAEDLPYINLWYRDNVLIHSRRVYDVHAVHSGNYDFLITAELQP